MEDYQIKLISFNVARDFIEKNHYTHGCSNTCIASYGLFLKESIIGVAIFINTSSKGAKNAIFGEELSGTVAEFHRLFIEDSTPSNTESWFIARSLKLLSQYRPQYNAVISFADETEGHVGIIYQATNAIYYGATAKNTFYIDKNIRLRHPRQVGTSANARMLGLKISRRLAKHRYLYLLGSSYKKKKLRTLLKVKNLEYPKYEPKTSCSKCKKVKKFEDFSPNKITKNGLQSQCKECHKKYVKSKREEKNAN